MDRQRPLKIIVNPVAGRGTAAKKLPTLRRQLADLGCEYQIELTHRPMEAADIANRSAKTGWDTIVAFGGDGTVNEVVNGLIGTDAVLGVLPCGTGNDFSRSLRIPKDIGAALRILTRRRTKHVDIGHTRQRYFINGMGIGFDALVNYESRRIRGLRGPILYGVSILRALQKYTAVEMEVRFNGSRRVGKTYLIAAGNGFSVGGGFMLTPDALLDDALFDICHVDNVSLATIFRHFRKLFNGKIGTVRQVTLDRSPNLVVAGRTGMPVHIDGEVLTTQARHVEVSLIPSAIQVIGNWN